MELIKKKKNALNKIRAPHPYSAQTPSLHFSYHFISASLSLSRSSAAHPNPNSHRLSDNLRPEFPSTVTYICHISCSKRRHRPLSAAPQGNADRSPGSETLTSISSLNPKNSTTIYQQNRTMLSPPSADERDQHFKNQRISH